MDILNKLTSAFRKKSDDLEAMWWSAYGSTNNLTIQQLYEGVVYSCIDITAKKAGAVPEYLYTGEGENKKKIENHPIIDLLHKPNRFQTWNSFQYLLYSYLRGHGEVFLYPVKSMSGKRVLELHLFNPLDVGVETGNTNFDLIRGYFHNGIKYQPEELIHIYTPNPYKIYRGVSPIEKARYDAEMDVKAMKWNNKIFENGANMTGLVSVDTNDQAGFERFVKEFKQKYIGVDNAGKVGVVKGNDVKFANFAVNQKDMDFVLQRKMSLERVLAIFQVPEIFLGMSRDTKFSNAAEVETIFNRDVIKPMLELTFEALNTWLVPMFGDRRLQLEFDNPVPEDKEHNLTLFDKGVNRWMTVNEIRKQLNMEPLEGEEYDTLQKPVTPSFSGEEEEPEQEGDEEDEKKLKKKGISEGLREAYLNTVYRYYEQKEEEYKKKVGKHYDRFLMALKVNRKAVSQTDIDGNMNQIYPDTTDWMEELYSLLLGLGVEVAGDAFSHNQDILQISADFNMVNIGATEYLKQKIRESVDSINNTLYNDARKILIEEMEKDEFDIAKAKKRIAEQLGLDKDWRVERIVRTELIDAYNETNMRVYADAGIQEKEWYTALDERVCKICKPLHKTRVVVDSKFQSVVTDYDKHGKLRVRTYTAQHPPIHVNCRCTLLPVI